MFCQVAVVRIPAAAITLWIDSYGGQESMLTSASGFEQCKVTYNERVVVFLANSRTLGKEC